jgi:hypothetical protein
MVCFRFLASNVRFLNYPCSYAWGCSPVIVACALVECSYICAAAFVPVTAGVIKASEILASLNTPHARNAINQAKSRWARDYLYRFRTASIHFIAHTLQRKSALLQGFSRDVFRIFCLTRRISAPKTWREYEANGIRHQHVNDFQCNRDIMWVDPQTLLGMLFTTPLLQGDPHVHSRVFSGSDA